MVNPPTNLIFRFSHGTILFAAPLIYYILRKKTLIFAFSCNFWPFGQKCPLPANPNWKPLMLFPTNQIPLFSEILKK